MKAQGNDLLRNATNQINANISDEVGRVKTKAGLNQVERGTQSIPTKITEAADVAKTKLSNDFGFPRGESIGLGVALVALGGIWFLVRKKRSK